MNAYADMLFSALLGWVRGLVQSLWSFFASGGSGGFFAWLGDHYLALAAILCLLGMGADLVTALARGGSASPLMRRLRRAVFGGPKEMERTDRRRFEKGYEDGIDMQDLNPEGEGHIPLFESNYPEAVPEVVFPDAGESPETAGTPRQEPEYRRRRGERHDGREKRRFFKHVGPLIADDEENGMLDRLPTTVDRKEAFHDPVYPHRRNRQ